MIRQIIRAVLPLLMLGSASLVATAEPVDKAIEETLRKTLAQPSLGMEVDTVETSVIPGLYEVQFLNGPMVHSTAKGDFFIVGDVFSVGVTGFTNLTEQRRDLERLELLADVKEEDMIVFSPEGETRGHITVFTDVSCFYCQKLHKEVPELNKRGVEVRYLAYPRSGVNSAGYKQLVTAWCAADPQNTLTLLKAQKSVDEKLCADNPVAAQYQLGQQLGVRGTPALITEKGTMIPGYQSADDLMVSMGLN